MKTLAAFLVLSIGLLLVPAAGVSAKEYNKRAHLDPGSQAKVNSVIAKSRQEKPFGVDPSGGDITNTGCGGLQVGPTETSGRPPREVIIVAKDIINVTKNCSK
jgi:hypothetical protein